MQSASFLTRNIKPVELTCYDPITLSEGSQRPALLATLLPRLCRPSVTLRIRGSAAASVQGKVVVASLLCLSAHFSETKAYWCCLPSILAIMCDCATCSGYISNVTLSGRGVEHAT